MPSDKDINDLQEYITQLEGQVQDLLLIIGDADSGLVKAVNDLSGQCESLQEQINAIDVSGLDGRITTLEGYFDANGKAKKALEAAKLVYESGAIDSTIQFNPVSAGTEDGAWEVSTGDIIAHNIFADNDDRIDDLESHFDSSGNALAAVKLYYNNTRFLEYDSVAGKWQLGGDLDASASDVYFSEMKSSTAVIEDADTSDPHNAGELWNDSGTVKMSAG